MLAIAKGVRLVLRAGPSRLPASLRLRRMASASPAAAAGGGTPGAANGTELSAAGAAPGDEVVSFGPFRLRAAEQVFFSSPLSHAVVNLKPLVPGHVLVIPRRVVARFRELSAAEVADLWLAAQHVGDALEGHYGAQSLTLAMQDGRDAGQTVPHVHIHVLPRKPGDFARNDDIYDALETNGRAQAPLHAAAAAAASQGAGDAFDGPAEAAAAAQKLDLDVERRPRTREEMAAEAAMLRGVLAAHAQRHKI